MQNSELFAAYMKEDIISVLLKDADYFTGVEITRPEKILLYHKYWKDMSRRPKFHNWEYLPQHLKLKFKKEVSDKFNLPDLRIPLDLVKQQLGIV